MAKKITNIIINILFGIVVVLSSYIIVAGLVSNSNGVPPSIFGYSFSTVPTPSMEKTIMTGDSIIFKDIPYEEIVESLENGEEPIIVFKSGNKFIVHRAIRLEDGGIRTKGDNNNDEDALLVTKDIYFGQVIHISSIGLGALFVNYRNVIFSIIAIILVFVLIKQIIKLVKEWISKENQRKEENKDKDIIPGDFSKDKFIADELEKYKKELLDEVKKGK